MSVSFAPVRAYVKRSLVSLLILGIVNLAVPASARASDDGTSRSGARTTALLAPGVLQRSIAVAARRTALQGPQTGADADKQSHIGCRTGAVLLGGAGAAFVTAWVKHKNWASSGATTTPGAKPPSSVGWSVAIGGVLAGAGIFMLSKSCGE